MFSKIVREAITKGGIIGAVTKVVGASKLKPWDPNLVDIGERQLCRGITKSQLERMLDNQQLIKRTTSNYQDLEFSDIGRQVMRGGDPNLLSFTRSIYTAHLYGANRRILPGDGAIIVGCYPAVFTDISEQAIMCPQMCDKEQKIVAEQILQSGDYYREAPDVVKVAAECNEICVIVGKQKDVEFDGLYDVNKFIQKIFHMIGTGRPCLGCIPISSCLVETFVNPDYVERALSLKIVLTTDPMYLEILEDSMKRSGKLPLDCRVLTPYDAAQVMDDPELRVLATAAASSAETTIITSVPQNAYGADMLDHLKFLFREELSKQADIKKEVTP